MSSLKDEEFATVVAGAINAAGLQLLQVRLLSSPLRPKRNAQSLDQRNEHATSGGEGSVDEHTARLGGEMLEQVGAK